jgi:hypothetical protein
VARVPISLWPPGAAAPAHAEKKSTPLVCCAASPARVPTRTNTQTHTQDAEPVLLEPGKCDGWSWERWGAALMPAPRFLPLDRLLARLPALP